MLRYRLDGHNSNNSNHNEKTQHITNSVHRPTIPGSAERSRTVAEPPA